MEKMFPDQQIQKLEQVLSGMNIQLTNDKLKKLIYYYILLVEKNKVMNLTAITEYDEVISKHFADSLAALSFPELSEILKTEKITILDLGTGAGFPGIPLAITLQNAEVTLADSLQKRTKFLNEVKKELNLENICIVNGRAEDLGRNKCFRENYDVVVSRAVADLRILTEYCMPFAKTKGSFIAWKGLNASAETQNAEKAIHELSAEFKNIYPYSINGEQRGLIHIEKTGITPDRYPRRAGIPSKRPL